jgi:hypothetical protein
MLNQLFNELKELPLQHYEMRMTADYTILLCAERFDEEHMEEARLIQESASKYEVIMHWDGRYIEIY